MIRTYPLEHAINQGKQKIIHQIVVEYRRLAKTIAAVQWRNFFEKGRFDKNLKIKSVPSQLSERYKSASPLLFANLLALWLC